MAGMAFGLETVRQRMIRSNAAAGVRVWNLWTAEAEG